MAGGLTNAGLAVLAQMAIGAAATAWSPANAYLGVGDSTTAYAATQTDLQAATNKLRKAMFSGSFPTAVGLVITSKSSFLAAEANFHWQEVILANASSGGAILYRDVTDLLTKPGTQQWDLTSALTLSAA